MNTMIIRFVLVGIFSLFMIFLFVLVACLIIYSVRSARRNNFSRSQFPGAFGMVDQTVQPPMDNTIPPVMDDGSSASPMPHSPDLHQGHQGHDFNHGHMSSPDAGSFGGGHQSGGFDAGGGSFSGGDGGGGGGHSH